MADINMSETSFVQDFLHADVGSGASGERLTVSLVLSHMGLDPDLEAERLSKLPRAVASRDLADIIVATPGSQWDLAAAAGISQLLVRILPVPAAVSAI